MSLAALTSYWALNLVQAAVVLLPGVARVRWLDALRSRWLLIAGPAAAVIALTFLPRVAAVLAADLSLLALVFVPPLAALGIAWAMRWQELRLVPLIPVLVAVAWSAPDNPVGKSAALLLVALSCVALAVVVVAVVPRAVVKIGIVAWAAADLSLALAHGLVEASRAISQAAPPVVPQLQLQRVVIGGASMEYADLFLAATLGAILAAESRNRGLAALVVAAVAMSMAAFLLVTNVIPATVPVAAALALEELRRSDHGPLRRNREDGATLGRLESDNAAGTETGDASWPVVSESTRSHRSVLSRLSLRWRSPATPSPATTRAWLR